MNSNTKLLFLAIQDRIASTFPEIRLIDLDMGQLDAPTRPALTFPAALIDFPEVSRSPLTYAYRIQASVAITLVADCYLPSSHDASLPVRSQALSFLDIEDRLIHALHLWMPTVEAPGRLMLHSSQSLIIPELRARRLSFSIAWLEKADGTPFLTNPDKI